VPPLPPPRCSRAQVNVPKGKKTFCKKCKKHAAHKVTQYKTGKASLFAQGACLQARVRLSPRAAHAAAHAAAGAAAAGETHAARSRRRVRRQRAIAAPRRAGKGWHGQTLALREADLLASPLLSPGKRRYDAKQSGYGGQTKPVFHKKARRRRRPRREAQTQKPRERAMKTRTLRAAPRSAARAQQR
jgi:ribosomal protein L44E